MAIIYTIDGNPLISMVIKLALTDEGHTVVTFNDSLNAYESLEKGLKPDVILVDLKMPGMNGKELVEKMRANPELDFIPVTFITGSIPSAEILPSKDSYQGLILKPFELQELIDTVDGLIA
ncbi:response regulator [Desulfosporosinus sp.]|uniref:response regulator n=1 Tax=Desulfosporosinus sp. TaxID=157907 RepID=UPI00230FA5B2|nr:response regulator [Desulfosporosinus sp.]MCO5388241.1 response regulator [Desulfosporosinus sp.]MDA8220414.1 response regulator [Desulfitobacterium hafniense]